jgi:osomolarity two-component system, sensor histidine kinase SLN1
MSSLSPPRELSENNLLEPMAHRWSRTMSHDGPDSDPDAPVLPPPVGTTPGDRPKKMIRIDGPHGLRVHWARFRRHLGAGTSPSMSSLVEDSAAGSNVGLRGDSQGGCQYEDDGEVDEVVVDRNWSDDIKSSASLSEQNISLDKPGHGTSCGHSNSGPGPSTDRDSAAIHAKSTTGGFWGLCTPLIILRWRLFPPILHFFSPKFPNQKSELHYVKETWFLRKVRLTFTSQPSSSSRLIVCTRALQSLAIWSSLFLVVNWALNAALVPGPVLLIDKVFLYGVGNSS